MTARGRNLRKAGASGEDEAARYLVTQGYRILERNFRFHTMGEIDIIAEEGEDLVFCEVKTRWGDGYGLPEDAVTPAKQRTIRKIAAAYLATHGIRERPCRCDVVSIRRDGAASAITLFRNAF
ncbi:MAG TPA: YraN family protein [Bacteroidota bacterium]|nr:YraN family protein [Bacteroidota bacterium]